MARTFGPFARSIIGIVAFIVLFAIVIAAGRNTAFVVGGFTLLGGFGALGDRRHNPFVGAGMIACGAVLVVAGFAM